MSKNGEISTSHLLPKMPATLQTQSGTEARATKKDRFHEADAVFTRTLESKKSDLALLNEQITAFQNDLASSSVQAAKGDHDDLLHRLAIDARKYEREIAFMTCRRYELIGRFMDAGVFKDVLTDVQTEDWDCADLVVDRIELPAEATVGFKSSRPEDFRARVMNAHGQDESDDAWCAILGRQTYIAVAAHIIDRNVGEMTISIVFGEPETEIGHLDSAENGLIMCNMFKQSWDNGEFVIVPVDKDANEYQVVVLHSQAQKVFEIFQPGERLDGRRLKFNSNFRPRKRYMYFKFLTTILRRQRFKVPNAICDRSKLNEAARALWAGPGSYLKSSTLYKISCRVGNLTEAAAMQLWGLKTPPAELGEEQERVTSAMASKVAAETVDVFHATAERSVCSHCKRPFDYNSLDDDDDDD